MILNILEKEGRPLMAKTISKLIYENFNGYRLYRGKVRDYLWNENELKKYVVYNGKPDYSYQLKSNAKSLKDLAYSKTNNFNFRHELKEPEKGISRVYSYSVKGKDILIESYLKSSDLKQILEALVISELQSVNDKNIKKALNKIKSNIIDVTMK